LANTECSIAASGFHNLRQRQAMWIVEASLDVIGDNNATQRNRSCVIDGIFQIRPLSAP
jgi:hypothetical protein